MKPLVSVAVPVFNAERFLPAALESLLAQDIEDFEILIGDNASTDRTLEIAESYARRDSRVRVFGSDTNRGASWNFNRLVEPARGTFFRWAAGDDTVAPQHTRLCVEALQRDPGVVLAYTAGVDVDEEGTIVRRYNNPPHAVQARTRDRVHSLLVDPRSPCFEAFGVFRTEQVRASRRLGGFTSADRAMFMEFAMLGRFEMVPEVLFFRRQHPDRSMRRYRNPQARAVWFDPARAGRRSYPQARLFLEYGRRVTSAHVPPQDRLDALAVLGGSVLRAGPSLAEELVDGTLRRPPKEFRRPDRGTGLTAERVER